MTPAVCGALALAALGAGFGLVQWLYTRRLLARLDRMLAGAVDGSFRESRFDESRLSALEGRLARFLNGSAASARELEGKRAAIQTLISDISHQTKTPIACTPPCWRRGSCPRSRPPRRPPCPGRRRSCPF